MPKTATPDRAPSHRRATVHTLVPKGTRRPAPRVESTSPSDQGRTTPKKKGTPPLPDFTSYKGLDTLTVLTLEYTEAAKAEAEAARKKTEVNAAILALLVKAKVPADAGVLCHGYSVRHVRAVRSTLSKDLLIQHGVKAAVLEKSYVTSVSTYATVRALASGAEEQADLQTSAKKSRRAR